MKNKIKSDHALYTLADRYVQLYGGQLLAEQEGLAAYGQESPIMLSPENWKAQRTRERGRTGGKIAAAGVGLLIAAVMIVTALPSLFLKVYDQAKSEAPEVTVNGPPMTDSSDGAPADRSTDLEYRRAEVVGYMWNQLAQAAGYRIAESNYDSDSDVFFFRLAGRDGEIFATERTILDASELDRFEMRQVAGRTVFTTQADGLSVLIYQPLNRAYRLESTAGMELLLDFFRDTAIILDSRID